MGAAALHSRVASLKQLSLVAIELRQRQSELK